MYYSDIVIACVRKPDGSIYAKVTDLYTWIDNIQKANFKDPESSEYLIEHIRKQLFNLL